MNFAIERLACQRKYAVDRCLFWQCTRLALSAIICAIRGRPAARKPLWASHLAYMERWIQPFRRPPGTSWSKAQQFSTALPLKSLPWRIVGLSTGSLQKPLRWRRCSGGLVVFSTFRINVPGYHSIFCSAISTCVSGSGLLCVTLKSFTFLSTTDGTSGVC